MTYHPCELSGSSGKTPIFPARRAPLWNPDVGGTTFRVRQMPGDETSWGGLVPVDLRGGDHACSGDAAPEPDEDPRQDPGAVLGSDLRLAGQQVPDRLHVREGAQEGPDEAGPAVLFPD